MAKRDKKIIYKFRDGNDLCTRANHKNFNNKTKKRCIKDKCPYLEDCILEDKDGK